MAIKKNYFLFILLLILSFASCTSRTSVDSYGGWKVCGGTKDDIHYSSLKQIDTSNVRELKVAWVYHSENGDSSKMGPMECNPIIINGIMYGVSPKLKLFAVDAATGKCKWTFNPADSVESGTWHRNSVNMNRGVTYWADGNDKRIIYTVGPVVFEVNAVNGKIIPSFGMDGGIDLHEGLGRDVKDLFIAPTSPVMIYKNLFIVGGLVSEDAPAAPGHIRAFDVRTGKQKWIFHTIPQPGEPGFETWEDSTAYKSIGSANNWSGFSLDEKRGILFAPTGSCAFDFYGGKRLGNDLYANCLLALDAATGKMLWHFQVIHHDVWDKDLPTPPTLVTVLHGGKIVDAVAQPTKHGFVFLFDRETGKPLFPIEEKLVPVNSPLLGEKLSPTQPMPTLPKPFVRQVFTEADINPLVSDTSYQDIKRRLKTYRTGNMFNAPSKEGTVIFPGFDGGAEWGGAAFDPKTGLLYVNANEMPWVLTMVDRKYDAPKNESNLQAGRNLYKQNCMSCHGPDRKGGGGSYPSLLTVYKKYTFNQFNELLLNGRRMMPNFKRLTSEERKAIGSFILNIKSEQKRQFIHTKSAIDTSYRVPYATTGYNKFLTKEGYPAISPPWGTLNAINLNTGEYVWKIPFGEFKELKKKGVPITGRENYGGSVVTAGGLLFIGATADGKFRAINKRTGKILWETDLPAPGVATPSVYAMNGKQYIVIACGGSKWGGKSSDAYVAFALPGN